MAQYVSGQEYGDAFTDGYLDIVLPRLSLSRLNAEADFSRFHIACSDCTIVQNGR